VAAQLPCTLSTWRANGSPACPLGGRDLVQRAGGLDWYALRPVKLTDGPLTGHVQASARFTMKTISRADVAWYILNLAEDPRPGQLRTPILTSAPRGGSPARLEAEHPAQPAPSAG